VHSPFPSPVTKTALLLPTGGIFQGWGPHIAKAPAAKGAYLSRVLRSWCELSRIRFIYYIITYKIHEYYIPIQYKPIHKNKYVVYIHIYILPW
jgi:hypothetical protein